MINVICVVNKIGVRVVYIIDVVIMYGVVVVLVGDCIDVVDDRDDNVVVACVDVDVCMFGIAIVVVVVTDGCYGTDGDAVVVVDVVWVVVVVVVVVVNVVVDVVGFHWVVVVVDCDVASVCIYCVNCCCHVCGNVCG